MAQSCTVGTRHFYEQEWSQSNDILCSYQDLIGFPIFCIQYLNHMAESVMLN